VDIDMVTMPAACPVCGKTSGGEAVHSTGYSDGLLYLTATVDVCSDCQQRLATGDVDVARLARKARVLLGGYGFSRN